MQNPVAEIHLQDGRSITLELYPQAAPNTVANFIHLCATGYFDGMIFCRVVNGRLIQSGDPRLEPEHMHDATPGYLLPGEFNREGFSNPLSFVRGTLGMAMGRDEPSPFASAGSFFIMVRDEARLDALVPAFGRVTGGMAVVDAICASPTHTRFGYDAPEHPVTITRISVETFGVQYPLPTPALAG